MNESLGLPSKKAHCGRSGDEVLGVVRSTLAVSMCGADLHSRKQLTR